MRLINQSTGEIVELDQSPGGRSLYRFKSAAKGLRRLATEQGLTVYFVTLTVRDDRTAEIMNADLHRFIDWVRLRLKRGDSPFFYAWVVELQRRRYRRTGVAALHWHFAIACVDHSLPDVLEKTRGGRPVRIDEGDLITFADLEKFWGNGFVWSVVAIADVYAYLSKYMGKDLGEVRRIERWSRLRRFGSSRMGIYSFPAWAFDQYQELPDEERELWFFLKRRGGVHVCGVDPVTRQKVAVAVWRSPWRMGWAAGGDLSS